MEIDNGQNLLLPLIPCKEACSKLLRDIGCFIFPKRQVAVQSAFVFKKCK